MKIFVIGGSGFVGRHLCKALLRDGHKVTANTRYPHRHRDMELFSNSSGKTNLKLSSINPFDENTLAQSLAGEDAVINLVGILNEKKRDGSGFQKAHVDLPAAIVRACGKTRVTRYLHMSALHADKNGPSFYLQSKGQAHELVHSAQTENFNVTSFCPSVIFGEGDSFIRRFAGLLKMSPPFFPLACAEAKFQPVFVEDVTNFMAASLQDTSTYGECYKLCGPDVFTLGEIVAKVAERLHRSIKIIPLSDRISKIQAVVLDRFPGKPFSVDNYNSLKIDSVCDGDCDGDCEFPQLKAYSVKPKKLLDVLPLFLNADNGRSAKFNLIRVKK